ncbi:type-F conjugative transfer system secretin TraK [Candidatus Tisiphia endosymbiont of Melanophora roralis]|uniref:TraK domain-containing protein n=1 Tax=Candidatus Tisiphia endosymbiont of Melanophora roralis TaxID=3066261 RepID=UPI00312CA864
MIKIILIIAMILTSNAALAAQEFEYIAGNKIKAKISASNVNRIEFGKIGIAQIIGDESKYKIIVDSKAQNIFLSPKIPTAQTLELALVNFSGNVADLILKVEDMEGQIIKISMDSFYNKPSNGFLNNSAVNNKCSVNTQEQEIAGMIRNMIADKEGKYYVTHVKRKIDRLHNIGLSIEQDRIYRFGKLIGARLVAINRKAQGLVHLKEVDFSNLFDFCLATTIDKTILLPKDKGFVWIVAKEQDRD